MAALEPRPNHVGCCVVNTYVTLASLVALSSVALHQSGRCQFDLIFENSTIAGGKPFWVAGRFRIEPQWHIYWTNPGEAGLPTGLDWKPPVGFKLMEVRWPVPKLIASQGSVSIGYEGEVAVLAKFMPPAKLGPSARVRLMASADWMACKEMCVTGEAQAAKNLRVASIAQLDPANKGAFARFRAALPEMGQALCPFVYEGNSRLRLEVKIPNHPEAKAMTFFPAKSGVTPASGEQVCSFGPTSFLVMTKSSGFRPTTYLEGVLSVEYSQNKRRAFFVNAPYKTP